MSSSNYTNIKKIELYLWRPKNNKYHYYILQKGKCRDSDESCKYTSTSGLEKTKKPKVNTIVVKAGINKSAKERLDTAFAKKITDLMKKGYKTEKMKSKVRFFPQRLKNFSDVSKTTGEYLHRKKILNWDSIYIQPKLDGVRAYTGKNGKGIYKHGGDKIESLSHVEADITKYIIPKLSKSIRLDGEIYDTKSKVVTNISKLINREEFTKAQLEKLKKLKYHIFDFYDESRPNLGFEERYRELKGLFSGIPRKNNVYIRLVKSHKIEDSLEEPEEIYDRIDEYFNAYLNKKYEGIVIRNGSAPYKVATSATTGNSENYKYKPRFEDDFEIVDVLVANRGNEDDFSIILVLKKDDGITFNASGSGSQAYQKKFYKNKDKYIGKKIRIEYSGWTKDNKPSFANPAKDIKGHYIFRGNDR